MTLLYGDFYTNYTSTAEYLSFIADAICNSIYFFLNKCLVLQCISYLVRFIFSF